MNGDGLDELYGAYVPDAGQTSPDTESLLELQRMELALLHADLEHPQTIAADQLRRLRYLLRLAHVTDFQPGAAEHGRRLPDRAEVSLGAELGDLRRRVIDSLHGPLRDERNPVARLERAAAHLAELAPEVELARRQVAERHADELTPRELDAELRTKALVSVAGGGGGAGYVYVGAYLRLHEAGVAPSYVIGASIGAVMGLFAARSRAPAWDEYLALARSLRAGELFGVPTRHRRYGLPGLLRLHLERTFAPLFSNADGEPTTVGELEIPYDAVVAGVRGRTYDRLPTRFRQPPAAAAPVAEAVAATEGAPPASRGLARARLGAAVAGRMWQVAAFFDPRMVKPVVLGADGPTAGLRAVDAAGFSSAIPGVLQYELAAANEALDRLFEREELAALVDGGVAANVPAALAWRSVQRGKIGTRNAFLLAFDCFHPQWDPRHLWLQPITQAVSLQRLRDGPYADWIVRFEPTLSPVTLVPSPDNIDVAIGWGQASVDKILPIVQRALEPVWWD